MTAVFETERPVLRPLDRQDAPAFVVAQNDPCMARKWAAVPLYILSRDGTAVVQMRQIGALTQ